MEKDIKSNKEQLEEFLKNKYYDFWYEIENIEKKEIVSYYEYQEYVCCELKKFPLSISSYDDTKKYFMNKHIDYLKEAFSSLLLGNYNAYSCLMRIIIENYVSIELIKKYQKKELWKYWYLFSYQKALRSLDDSEKEKIQDSFINLCKKYDVDIHDLSIKNDYGWLKRIGKLEKYNFFEVCKLVNQDIYQDYEHFSQSIHNNNYFSKMNLVDMKLLTKYIFLLYDYTDKMIHSIYPSFIRRKDYYYFSISLLDYLNQCSNEYDAI